MADLSLVATSIFPTSSFHQEQSIFRAPKEFHPFQPCSETRKDTLRSGTLQHLRFPKPEDTWNSMGWMLESDHYVKLDSTVKRPVLIDVKESRPDSVLFSFGNAQQCTRQQNILRFLMSGSSEAGREGVEFSPLSDFVGIDTCKIHMHLQTTPSANTFCLYEVGRDDYCQRSLIFSTSDLYRSAPLTKFLGDLASSMKTAAQPDGLLSFSGNRPEMNDLLSIVEEFYPSKNSTKLRNQTMLIPQYARTEASETLGSIRVSCSTLQTVTVTPLKSPRKINLNPLPKKRNNRRVGKERDVYRRSYFHACESLLSLILGKRHGSTAISSLFDPELPQLLTQFSAGIAGSGLAVLFSIVCKVSGGNVPFCASKMLDSGFGLGLVWLSWAVNKLRDTIVRISKNTISKVELKDKEMIRRVDRVVNDIFFRAATVMVFAMLKFV